MATATGTRIEDAALIGGILARVALDLGALMGLDVHVSGPSAERAAARPAGKGAVHISFRLGLAKEGVAKRYGALLVPLPEAITMACLLLMLPEEAVAVRRSDPTLDETLKDAMLEIGNMLGNASNTALAELGAAGWSIRSEGCQGVRAGVRPAFPYEEGSALVVGRASARFEPFPPFELILMLPPLD